ncbi:MAG: hypothetical protein ACOZE7_06320 [Pseudomonadota bacterium]|jgi:SRSO17 transposase
MKYWLSTLPEKMAPQTMVLEAKSPRGGYRNLKQDLGLGDYEGRGWRVYHNHASLAIAAYGFLDGATASTSAGGGKKHRQTQRRQPGTWHTHA